jgi:hypothetical protein
MILFYRFIKFKLNVFFYLKAWKLVGRIMCHDNISKRDFLEKMNINLYDINKGCPKSDTKHNNGNLYGFGRALSKNDTLYHVRLFFQKS